MPPRENALTFLHTMLGSQAAFRPGKWEAITAVAVHKKRVLIVQRTGWGNSLAFFLVTKLLRDQDAGTALR
jgi:ATP-dependent DNA helicase RecQ